MKKLIFLFLTIYCSLFTVHCYTQAPQLIPYQSVVRNSSGNLVANQLIGLRFRIHDISADGTIVYEETTTATTNDYGMFTSTIGAGTATIGTFAGIIWATGAKYIETDADITGGTTYIDLGTHTQLMSVPYALFAGSSGSWAIAGSDIYNNNTGNVGIGTTNPQAKLDVSYSGSPTEPQLRLYETKTDWVRLSFQNANSSDSWIIGGYNDPSDGTNNRFGIYNSYYNAGGLPILRLSGNGNVGIGSENPQAKLDVNGNIRMTDGSQAAGKVLTSDDNGIGSWQDISGGSSQWTNSGNDIYNNNSGNVGIGTTTPASKLDVNGDINSGSVYNIGGTTIFSIKGNNLYVGPFAGSSNNSGWENLFVGKEAGSANTTGYRNHFVGFWAGFSNTTGNNNHFDGMQAGQSNTNGSDNLYIGNGAGFSNTIGFKNHFVGYSAGYKNTTASNNHFEGYQAGYSNTTGNNNHFEGNQAGYLNTTGMSNYFVGVSAGFQNTTGNYNHFEGNYAGLSNMTGSGNLFVGNSAGSNNFCGSYNTCIGTNADLTKDGLTNAAAIGYNAKASHNNTMILGDTGTYAVNVGIGTVEPHAKLDIKGGSVLFEGTSGVTPISGVGTRMMWIPAKGAFRAGAIYPNGSSDPAEYWNDANIGQNSFAAGYDTQVSGNSSTAFGSCSKASGDYSFATGYYTQATGDYSTAMGRFSLATGYYSTALGSSEASGWSSIAIGNNMTEASGDNSTALGNFCSTNNKRGAFVIGDYNIFGSVYSTADNEFSARFQGGYRLFTDEWCSIGVSLAHGGNSWSIISDVRKKENFATVDGEDFLKKIGNFNLTSWNYKGQDPSTFRHYGPMSQDFYAAFGKDKYGIIGNDTTINSADFAGVSFIAIKALVKRTDKNTNELNTIISKLQTMQMQIDILKVNNNSLKADNELLKAKLSDLDQLKEEIKSLKSEMIMSKK